MIKYHKIETPYRRSETGTKKLIEGAFRDPTVEALKDIQWAWTEKIDGTNISVEWDGHSVSIHGRTERADIPKPLLEKLEEMFCGDVNEEMFEQIFGETHMILYGEGYGPKIQNGGDYRADVSFALFDIYQPESDIWLARSSVEDIAMSLCIECVPFVGRGTIDEAVEFVKGKHKSCIGHKKPMEGIVCRPSVELKDKLGKRVIVKIKAKDFD